MSDNIVKHEIIPCINVPIDLSLFCAINVNKFGTIFDWDSTVNEANWESAIDHIVWIKRKLSNDIVSFRSICLSHIIGKNVWCNSCFISTFICNGKTQSLDFNSFNNLLSTHKAIQENSSIFDDDISNWEQSGRRSLRSISLNNDKRSRAQTNASNVWDIKDNISDNNDWPN